MFSVPKLTWIPHSLVILLPIAQMCNHLCAPIIHICGQLGFVFWNLSFQILDLSLINANELDYWYLSRGFLHLHWLGFWTCQYEHRISLFFLAKYGQKVMDKNGLWNWLKDFFFLKEKNHHIAVDRQQSLTILRIARKAYHL
jgi:hypothetical protein